ncbi:hypothetical protein HPB51_002062 [Rhipicephalus microplus]|uniref:Uncharacterized protein n=1 Tax=Rhipicephalus microplus TaxID=6941 RepID=A0A9J6E654_RHIMP|nr:hypothetical protein HPB51_002062 [Rhipicephalus microplus]
MKRAQEVEERERLMFERETIRRKEEAESQERELERLRLQLKIAEAKGASDLGTENAEIQAGARVIMRDPLQPYKMSEDVALYLVNIERTCLRMRLDRIHKTPLRLLLRRILHARRRRERHALRQQHQAGRPHHSYRLGRQIRRGTPVRTRQERRPSAGRVAHGLRQRPSWKGSCWSAVQVATSLNQASGSLADLVSWLPASGCVTQPGVRQPCGPGELASRSVAGADTGTGSIVCSWPEVLGPEWWHEVAAAHVGYGPLTCTAVAW